jgi:hypothetical protein
MKRPRAGKLLVGATAVALGLVFLTASQGVYAQTSAADEGELRDITGIEQVPEEPTSELWPLAAALVGPLVVGLLATWLWRRRRKFVVPAVAPERWALAELERLGSRRLAEQGQVEQFHTLLSGIVRRYLELRFQIPASRQTTPEFLVHLADSAILSPEQQVPLRAFLERCDLAKFAQAGFSTEECTASAQAAADLVAQTTLPSAHPVHAH